MVGKDTCRRLTLPPAERDSKSGGVALNSAPPAQFYTATVGVRSDRGEAAVSTVGFYETGLSRCRLAIRCDGNLVYVELTGRTE